MILEKAQVIHIDDDVVTVSAQIKTTCNACQAQSDCGTGTIAKAFASRHQSLTIQSLVPVKVGDVVTIGMPEERVLSASVWLYLVPLLTLLASTIAIDRALGLLGLDHELLAFAGALLMTFLSFVWVSGRLKKQDKHHFQPVIIPPSP